MAEKILIVDDQEEIRELIRLALEFDDYELHEASSGEQGLSAAQQLRPALMLLDVMMPGALNGLQVCRRIKADPELRAIKIVLLTARGQDADRQAGLEAGADHYLIKPFSPLELMKMIDQALA